MGVNIIRTFNVRVGVRMRYVGVGLDVWVSVRIGIWMWMYVWDRDAGGMEEARRECGWIWKWINIGMEGKGRNRGC